MVHSLGIHLLLFHHRTENNSITSSNSSPYGAALQYTATDLSQEPSVNTLNSFPLHMEGFRSVLPIIPRQGIPSFSNIEDTDEEDHLSSNAYNDSYSDSDAESKIIETVATVIRKLIDEPSHNFSPESLKSAKTSTPRSKRSPFRFLSRTSRQTDASALERTEMEKSRFRHLFNKLTSRPR